MRRVLATAAAVSVLPLAACSSSDNVPRGSATYGRTRTVGTRITSSITTYRGCRVGSHKVFVASRFDCKVARAIAAGVPRRLLSVTCDHSGACDVEFLVSRRTLESECESWHVTRRANRIVSLMPPVLTPSLDGSCGNVTIASDTVELTGP